MSPPASFEKALSFTLRIEGGFSDHASDHGGPTMNGFTQALYDAWRAATGQVTRSVTMITTAEKVRIAREEFWNPCRCDELPGPLALAVFDMAFNSSPQAAARCLQRALGFVGNAVDGRIGKVTIAAANAADPYAALLELLKKRGDFIQQALYADRRQIDFVEGWIARLLDILDRTWAERLATSKGDAP